MSGRDLTRRAAMTGVPLREAIVEYANDVARFAP